MDMAEFKAKCTPEQWEKYVEGALELVNEFVHFYEDPAGKPNFTCVDPFGGGNITLGWDEKEQDWMETVPATEQAEA